LKGADGMLVNARKGLVLCDLTTSDPVDTRRLAKQAATRVIHYLDAGMSGGPAGITDGSLALMVGGDAKVLKRIQPVLDAFAKNVFHLGASGSGHAMKLINNMVLHTTFLATCEGARLTERMGMRVADMIKVFNTSNARSYASEVRFPKHILSGKWDARSRVYNLRKDLTMAVKLAGALDTQVPLGTVTRNFLNVAMFQGMEDTDFSKLYERFDDIVADVGPK
jgi:3-hydroxyisobutyrate dehydrogenase